MFYNIKKKLIMLFFIQKFAELLTNKYFYMKKRILTISSIIAFAVLGAFNFSVGLRNNAKMDMAFEKIEATAKVEEAGITCTYPNCYMGKCLDRAYENYLCPCPFTGIQTDFCAYGK